MSPRCLRTGPAAYIAEDLKNWNNLFKEGNSRRRCKIVDRKATNNAARTAVWIVRFSFAAALRYLGMTSPSWCSFQEVLFRSAKSVSMLNFTSFPVLFSSQIVPLVD